MDLGALGSCYQPLLSRSSFRTKVCKGSVRCWISCVLCLLQDHICSLYGWVVKDSIEVAVHDLTLHLKVSHTSVHSIPSDRVPSAGLHHVYVASMPVHVNAAAYTLVLRHEAVRHTTSLFIRGSSCLQSPHYGTH